MEIIIALVSAFLGAIASAYFANNANLKQNRIQTTLQMYSDFQSQDMLETRHQAEKFIMENRELSLSQLSSINEHQFRYVSLIIHYFEQLSILKKHGYIDKRLLKGLFGRYYIFWHKNYFQHLFEKEYLHSEWRDLIASLNELEFFFEQR
jgi:hypothetical protein